MLKTWTDLTRASLALAALGLEAQGVIWMRLWGMAGAWNLAPGENRRMVHEKLAAGLAAQTAAAAALMAGKTPTHALGAAIKPVRRRTGANLRRLARRGPKI